MRLEATTNNTTLTFDTIGEDLLARRRTTSLTTNATVRLPLPVDPFGIISELLVLVLRIEGPSFSMTTRIATFIECRRDAFIGQVVNTSLMLE